MPPDDTEAESPLLVSLRRRIARDGPLPVDRYMLACLADPEHGYWSRANMLGAAGDFVTSPEISQMFGELVGLWCAVTWQQMGSPAPLRLVELGPGRGTLMRDALRACRKVPGFLDAASVHLVEISPALRETQHQTLASIAPVCWHQSVDELPEGPAIVIANEFLDALPIRQLVHAGGVWRERVVTVDAQGALMFAAGEPAKVGPDVPAQVNAGDILELRAGEDQLLAQLAARSSPVVALFIDYGPAAAAIGDTLQAVRHHAYVDPLSAPGTADLTAHVLFAGLVAKARAAGLTANGPITQAEFLGRLGIAERAARLMAANPAKAGDIEASVQRLVSPTGMGQLFKVLAVRSPSLPPPPPFG
jgi:NADH dehydrogenase [ubiquinone] 1 alpha subcomplex assembly factor 7